MSINPSGNSEHLYHIRSTEDQRLFRLKVDPEKESSIGKAQLTDIVSRLPKEITSQGEFELKYSLEGEVGLKDSKGNIRLVRLATDQNGEVRELNVGGMRAPLHTPKKSWTAIWSNIHWGYRWILPISAAVTTMRWLNQPDAKTKSGQTLNALLDKMQPKSMGDFRDLLKMEASILNCGDPSEERLARINETIERANAVVDNKSIRANISDWVPNNAGEASLIPGGYNNSSGTFQPVLYAVEKEEEGTGYRVIQMEIGDTNGTLPQQATYRLPNHESVENFLNDALALARDPSQVQEKIGDEIDALRRAANIGYKSHPQPDLGAPTSPAIEGRVRIEALIKASGGELVSTLSEDLSQVHDGFDLLGAALTCGDETETQHMLAQQSLNSLEYTLRLAETAIQELPALEQAAVATELHGRLRKMEERLLPIFQGDPIFMELWEGYRSRVDLIAATTTEPIGKRETTGVFDVKTLKSLKSSPQRSASPSQDALTAEAKSIRSLRSHFQTIETEGVETTTEGSDGFQAVTKLDQIESEVTALILRIDSLVESGEYVGALDVAKALQALLPTPQSAFWAHLASGEETTIQEKFSTLNRWAGHIEKITKLQAEASLRLHRRAPEPREVLDLLNGRAVLGQIAQYKGELVRIKMYGSAADFPDGGNTDFWYMPVEGAEDRLLQLIEEHGLTHEEATALFLERCSPDYLQLKDLIKHHPLLKQGMSAEADKRARDLLDFVDGLPTPLMTIRMDGEVDAPEEAAGQNRHPNPTRHTSYNDRLTLLLLDHIARRFDDGSHYQGGSVVDEGFKETTMPKEGEGMVRVKTADLVAQTRHNAFSQMLIRPDVCFALNFGSGASGGLNALGWWQDLQDRAQFASDGDKALFAEYCVQFAYSELAEYTAQISGRLDLEPDEYVIGGKPTLSVGNGSQKIYYLPWGLGLPAELTTSFSPAPNDFIAAEEALVEPSRMNGGIGRQDFDAQIPSEERERWQLTVLKGARTVQEQRIYTETGMMQRCLRQEEGDAVDEYLLRTLEVAHTNTRKGREVKSETLIETFQLIASRSDLLSRADVRAQLDLLFAHPGRLHDLISDHPDVVVAFCDDMKKSIEEQSASNPFAVAFMLHIGSLIEEHAGDNETVRSAAPSYRTDFFADNPDVETKRGAELLSVLKSRYPDVYGQALVEAARLGMINPEDFNEALTNAAYSLNMPLHALGSPLYLPELASYYKIDLQAALTPTETEAPLGTSEIPLPAVVRRLMPEFNRLFGTEEIIVTRAPGEIRGQWNYKFSLGGSDYSIQHSVSEGKVTLRQHIGTHTYRWASVHTNGVGIAALADERGLWVNEANPFECHVITSSLTSWSTDDAIALTVDPESGAIEKAVINGQKATIASSAVANKLTAVHSDHILQLGDKEILLNDKGVRLTMQEGSLKLAGEEYTLVQTQESPPENASRSETVAASWHHALTEKCAMRFTGAPASGEKIYLWPNKLTRAASGTMVAHPTSDLSEARNEPMLELEIEKDGTLTGSSATFLYMAYALMKNREFSKAQYCLERASTAGLDSPTDRAAFERVTQLMRDTEPTTGRGIATRLKAELTIRDILRAQLGEEEYTPSNSVTFRQTIQQISSLYATYQGKVSDERSELYRNQSLQLTEAETQRLEGIRKEAFHALLVDRAALRSVPTESWQTVQSLPNEVAVQIALRTKGSDEEFDFNTLNEVSPLTSEFLLANFCNIYNGLLERKRDQAQWFKELRQAVVEDGVEYDSSFDTEAPAFTELGQDLLTLLSQPLEDARGHSLSPAQQQTVEAADIARRLLLQIALGEPKPLKTIDRDAVAELSTKQASPARSWLQVISKGITSRWALRPVKSASDKAVDDLVQRLEAHSQDHSVPSPLRYTSKKTPDDLDFPLEQWTGEYLEQNFYALVDTISRNKEDQRPYRNGFVHHLPKDANQKQRYLHKALVAAALAEDPIVMPQFHRADQREREQRNLKIRLRSAINELEGLEMAASPAELVSAVSLVRGPLQTAVRETLPDPTHVITRNGIGEPEKVKKQTLTDGELINVQELGSDRALFDSLADEMALSELEKQIYWTAISELKSAADAGGDALVPADLLFSGIDTMLGLSTMDIRREEALAREIDNRERAIAMAAGQPAATATDNNTVPATTIGIAANIRTQLTRSTDEPDDARLLRMTRDIPERLRALFNPETAPDHAKAEYRQLHASVNAAQARVTKQLSWERTLKRDEIDRLRTALSTEHEYLERETPKVKNALLEWGSSSPFPDVQRMIRQSDRYSDSDILNALLDRYQRMDSGLDGQVVVIDGRARPIDEVFTTYLIMNSALQQIPDAQARLEHLAAEELSLNGKGAGTSEYEAYLENSRRFCEVIDRNLNPNRYLDADQSLREPQLFRKILVAENRLGIVMREGQEEALIKLNKDPAQWISLRMGEGKTFFIMPVVAELLVERGHLPLMLVPEQLAGINRADFDKTTRAAFGHRAEPFNPDLERNCSSAYLATQYETLLKLHQEKRYAVTSVDTLASISNMLPRLRNESTKLFEMLSEGAALAGLPLDEYAKENEDGRKLIIHHREVHKQIHWLQRIDNLLDGGVNGVSPFLFGDEVDSTLHISKEINRAIGDKSKPNRLICDQMDTVMMLLWDDSPIEGLSDDDAAVLGDLRERLQQGTQVTISKQFKEDYLPAICRALLKSPRMQEMIDPEGSKYLLEQVPEDELVGFLCGARHTAPTNLRDWDDRAEGAAKDQQQAIAALKHILSLTLPSIMSTDPGQKVKFTDDDGFQAVPAELGLDTPGSRFGDEFELVGFQDIAYKQARINQAKNGKTLLFFEEGLRKLQAVSATDFNAIRDACLTSSDKEKMDLEEVAHTLLNNDSLWRERTILMRKVVLEAGLIRRYNQQSQMSVQSTTTGRKIGGVTGTLNLYGLPNFDASKKSDDATRVVEMETFLRMAANHKDGLDHKVTVFNDTDPAALSAHMNGVLGDPECQAIIMEGGYGMEGKSGSDYIASLRELENGASKNFLYVEGGKAYLWKAGSDEPTEANLSQLKKEKCDWVCVYSPEYTRGTDLPIGVGKTYYFPKRAPNAQDMGQSIWRGRGTGDRHTPEAQLPQSVGMGEEVTLGEFLQWVVEGSVAERLPFNLMTERLRVNEIAGAGVRQALNEMRPEEMRPEHWDPSNTANSMVLNLFNDGLHELFRDYGIVDKSVDFKADYSPTREIPTLDSLSDQCTKEIERLESHLGQLGTVGQKVLEQLSEVAGDNSRNFATAFAGLSEGDYEKSLAQIGVSLTTEVKQQVEAAAPGAERDLILGQYFLGFELQQAIESSLQDDQLSVADAYQLNFEEKQESLWNTFIENQDLHALSKARSAKATTEINEEDVKEELRNLLLDNEPENFGQAVEDYYATELKLSVFTAESGQGGGATASATRAPERAEQTRRPGMWSRFKKKATVAGVALNESWRPASTTRNVRERFTTPDPTTGDIPKEKMNEMALAYRALGEQATMLQGDEMAPVRTGLERCAELHKKLAPRIEKLKAQRKEFTVATDEDAPENKLAARHQENLSATTETVGSGAGSRETVKQQQKQKQATSKKSHRAREVDATSARRNWFNRWNGTDVNAPSEQDRIFVPFDGATGIFFTDEAMQVLNLLPSFRGDPIFKLLVNKEGEVMVLGKNDYHNVIGDATNTEDFVVVAPNERQDIQLKGTAPLTEEGKRRVALTKLCLGFNPNTNEHALLKQWFKNEIGDDERSQLLNWARKNRVDLEAILLTD